MRTLFNNKITFTKIIVLMIVGLAAIAYNVNLFTSDYNIEKNAISIEQVYYTWDERKASIKDIIEIHNRFADLEIKKKYAKSKNEDQPKAEDLNSENQLIAEETNSNSKLKSLTSVESVNDVKIKKDELLYVKFFNPESLALNDSLFENYNNEKMRVEFWHSPINYIGYKKEKNKIILYGISEFDEVNLKFAKNIICLKYKGGFFEIKENKDFQPLTPISNEEIIAIINEEDGL